jgi:transcription initiation factor IIE alpha subunit
VTEFDNLVFCECWNCKYRVLYEYGFPEQKPKICPSCGEKFMSSMDKKIIEEVMEKITYCPDQN